MSKPIKRVQRVTSKGQITLPASWRKDFKTDQVIVESKGDSIEISPLTIGNYKEDSEYTVFDAIKDNEG